MDTGGEERTGLVAAIIPAGGASQRFGPGQPKQFVDLVGWPVLAHTLSRFEQAASVDQVIVVVPYEQVTKVRKNVVDALGFAKARRIVAGGETRQESVYQGFLTLEDEIALVVIHDGVRPLVQVPLIEAVVETAREHGAAIAAVPVRDTLKQVENGVIQNTLDRRRVWQAQTPQAFDRHWLARALAEARRDGFVGTDEAVLIERLGWPVHVVPGSTENVKITMPEDLVLAETLIKCGQEKGMRIGLGFDVHPLIEGRRLMLGGLEVPFERGLAGHSDADVIVHALCDALLGAAGLGDIGRHFPDSDPAWSGASGTTLLGLTAEKIKAAGYDLESADLTLLAERPKIKAHSARMAKIMAEALNVSPSRLNVKATTMEGLGAVGREEGLAAAAVVLLRRKAACRLT
ncbi:MAG: 2-C-methyl-D-erythritol 4-phosphate cytidylyltransferase [Thermodesulfobacteriota bacterium]